MDISITIYAIDLRFSVYILKVPLEGIVSQIFYLGPSFYFMAKNQLALSRDMTSYTFHQFTN